MIEGVHHASLAVQDMDRALGFYVGVLGLQQHPGKLNWLLAGDGYALHLMPARLAPPPQEMGRHVAFAVGRLETVVERLLHHGLQPYQATVDQSEHHPVRDPGDPLTFGIGTVFVDDPDGNAIEFVQSGRGILGQYGI